MSYVHPLMPSELTARDHIAIKAMQGMITAGPVDGKHYVALYDDTARIAYVYADAMLNARAA